MGYFRSDLGVGFLGNFPYFKILAPKTSTFPDALSDGLVGEGVREIDAHEVIVNDHEGDGEVGFGLFAF